MKITLLIPGTGHFHCGSCLRDLTLAKALRGLGHDVTMVPLYLPFMTEDADRTSDEVLMGGINMYLQQKSRLFARLPQWLHNRLDTPGLLRWVAARAGMTEPAGLGAMTLSLLEGEHGRQTHELDRLVEWMTGHERPDVICLSNVLLSGMARRLKEATGVSLVCTLQGEAPFLDALPSPFRDQAWATLGERVNDIDALVPVSRHYGELMRGRLDVDESRMHVVYNGIDVDELQPAASGPERPTIGYLARMCADKGLHTLVEAFCILRSEGRVPEACLHVAGTKVRQDDAYVRGLRKRLRAHGLDDDARFDANVDRDEKHRFLSSLSVLSVPATYGESFGLYVLESLAVGVPVVQPRSGAFPELIEATEGGLLCEPDDPRALAGSLEELLLDERRAREIGARGRDAVLERFTAKHMARGFEQVCMMVAS